jgi:hypothetical protein
MKTRVIRTLLAVFAASAGMAQGAPARFELPAPVTEIVTSPGQFARFVAPVRAALPGAGLDDRLRLGMQAHLALNDRDAPAALAAGAALRVLETDPAAKALAGLVTEAQVAAWRPDTTFSRELTTRLAGLPPGPEITARLRNLREKIAATTRDHLLAEAAALGRRFDSAGQCDWAGADEIIRLHHRLANVLTLRTELLAVLDEAIDARIRR